MPYRVGVVALLHESNTFLREPTTLVDFEQDLLVTGGAVRDSLAVAHHEVGGFFSGLDAEGIGAVPVFAARALPGGRIAGACAARLIMAATKAVGEYGPYDGLLVAIHGAAVAEHKADFDGAFLSVLRQAFPRPFPILGTVDLHANVSLRMVEACDALIAYRTNPHLDQRDRGVEAARLMGRTLRGEVRPTTAAAFPPLAVNIERQATAEPHWRPLLDLAADQRTRPGVLSNSLVYGFPYGDVAEMGSSALVVTDGNPVLARRCADELARNWWDRRADFAGEFRSVESAVLQAAGTTGPVCLLDMGDNIGGGSPGDGTVLARALIAREFGASLIVIRDPDAVQRAEAAGVGATLALSVGGKTDDRHGPPLESVFVVRGLSDGRFGETEVRHGGIRTFDQGRSVVVETTDGVLTVLLTSRRMAPFSLNQLTSCGIDPRRFRVIVAKGVHAPVAAYAPVCRHLIRVNTPGVTTADMTTLPYHHRRRPMYPFEPDAEWPVTS